MSRNYHLTQFEKLLIDRAAAAETSTSIAKRLRRSLPAVIRHRKRRARNARRNAIDARRTMLA